MRFDPTVSAGTIVEVVSMTIVVIIAVMKVLRQIDRLQMTVQEHTHRLNAHDSVLTRLLGQVERMIGRQEAADARKLERGH